MPRNKWTKRQLSILRKEYPKIEDLGTLCTELGKSLSAVKSRARLLGLKRLFQSGSPWKPELVKQLIKLYPNKSNAEIASKLGLRETQIEPKAFLLGLSKTKEFMRERSAKTAFKKGHIPLNKGKKQVEYMSKEAIARTEGTRFQKGHLPHNAVGVNDGDIRIRHDHKNRGGKAYKYIRLALGKWYPLHQHNWETEKGKIPKGYCLWFTDGDTMNCDVSNLELITRAENMRRNSCSVRLTDNYVAMTLSREKGKVGAFDLETLEKVKKNPDLIKTKRAQLLLLRTIKEKSNGKK